MKRCACASLFIRIMLTVHSVHVSSLVAFHSDGVHRRSVIHKDACERDTASSSNRAHNAHRWQQEVAVICAIATSVLLSSTSPANIISPPSALATNIDMTFENGKVQLDDPLRSFANDRSFGNTLGELRHPQFLGSGGGGAVFTYNRVNVSPVVVKVSWIRSAASVERECEVLKYMEESSTNHHVEGVEKCLGRIPYPADTRRTMIVMEPFMDDSVASVPEIRKELREHSVSCIVRTLVQMLAAGVLTTDVQPLISRSTGEVVFIDMTEAKIVSTAPAEALSFLDMALASSFCSEMFSLIPEEYVSIASDALIDELKAMAVRGASTGSDNLPRKELLELIQQQGTLLSREATDYIEAKIL